MTIAQQAFATGFSALLSIHGQTWTRAEDSAAVQGVPAGVIQSAVSLPQSQDKSFALVVADAALVGPLTTAQVMPAERLAKGDELTKGDRNYRVVSADLRESNMTWLVILSPTF